MKIRHQDPVPAIGHTNARPFFHHALLCVGTHEECLARISSSDKSTLDTEIIISEQLDVDEARALWEKAVCRPMLGGKRRFVISCIGMTLEAQNALLKLFEDPPATAQFYIIVPRVSALLPTLRSRLHLLYEADEASDTPDTRTASFLSASFAGRLEMIATLAKEKDTASMRALIRGIERATAAQIRKHGDAAYLSDVLLVSSYSENRGSSHKMLLEHLALSVATNL